VPVPDSGTVAAIVTAKALSFRFGLVRTTTLAAPLSSRSSRFVRLACASLNPVRHLIAGKRVVLIDDSIVRGTTSKKIVRMVREAGAKEIHCGSLRDSVCTTIDTPTLT